MAVRQGHHPRQVGRADRTRRRRTCPIAVAVTNSATHYVLSGYPEDLAAFGVEVAKEHKRQAKLREEKVRGGRVFDPTLEYLDVTLPFHSPLMADAVSQAVAWAEPAASTPTCP